METNTESEPLTLPTVHLRDLGRTVYLQTPQEKLKLVRPTWHEVDLGRMSHRDAVKIALAQAGAILNLHRKRWLETERLSEREAESIPHASLVTESMVEAVVAATCESWRESEGLQCARRALVRKVLEAFLGEISRG